MDVALALAMLGAPWVAAAAAAGLRGRRFDADAVARVAASITGVGFIAAVAAAFVAFTGSPIRLGVGVTEIRLDALAVLLGMLVLGLSALIQAFAVRYLRGDPRQRWFVVSAAVLTGFTTLLVCAGSLIVFAVAWVGAVVAMAALLATYPHLEQARDGVRRLLVRLAIADTAFLAGVVILLVANRGDSSLAALGEVAARLPEPAQLTVAALLVIGALAHSSQIPFQGWLPFTLAAPTPVSAMLHAGVVNAGAILLLRFAPVIAAHQEIMIGIFAIGAATLLYASAARLVRADVKGRLVFSTMAQMGFMIMACGLGAFAAAIFHLIAHSLFKSSLFLGAGMGVRSHAVDRDLPEPKPLTGGRRVLAIALSIAVSVGAVIAAEVLLAPTASPASIGLLVFIATTAALTLATALATRFTLGSAVAGITSVLAVIIGYTVFLGVFSSALDPLTTGEPAPAWLLVIPASGLIALEIISRTGAPLAWRDRLYARSLTSTTPRLTASKGLPA
ncbi:MAG: proton-conducting transporter membrane subunit [Rhodoglobus sp.]